MRCPTCGASVRDDALECPRCHTALDVTCKFSLAGATWCPGCGALLAPGTTVCPSCGSSLRNADHPRSVREAGVPDIGHTGMMDALDVSAAPATHIESAIPPEGDEESPAARRDRIPRPRAFAFAALFAVLIVGGATLLITHPWDPMATQTRAKEPADTSMSGFPGVVELLTGQDVGRDPSSDGPSELERLESAHESLGTLSERADASEGELRAAVSEGDASAGADGLSAASSLSMEVSNLITEVTELRDLGGEYADGASELLTLGSWLRNRCDALVESWQRLADAEGSSFDGSHVLSPVTAALDYDRLFSSSYGSWSATGSD